MNPHPIIVHFPVALLTLYVVFECLRFKRLMERSEWFWIKGVFVWLGGLGALAALVTGDYGKPLYPDARALIRAHENFAHYVIALFGLIAAVYFVLGVEKIFGEAIRRTGLAPIWKSIVVVADTLCTGPVMVPAALVGLALLTITGALGGSIVYGPDTDPLATLVNHWFVIQ